MKLSTFVKAAHGIDLPSGNYILKAKKTGNLYWFTVYAGNYPMTTREVHRPDSERYEEFVLYYNLHLPTNRDWHSKLFAEIRRPK